MLKLRRHKRPVEARENEVRFLGVPRLPFGELGSCCATPQEHGSGKSSLERNKGTDQKPNGQGASLIRRSKWVRLPPGLRELDEIEFRATKRCEEAGYFW